MGLKYISSFRPHTNCTLRLYYFSCFTDEKTEGHGITEFTKVTELGSGEATFGTQEFDFTVYILYHS